MIWTTVSSWSYFCWLCRASPSLLAKNISVWFRCWPSGDVYVQSLLLCCWKRVFAMPSAFSCKTLLFCPASFHIPRPNLPVTPGVLGNGKSLQYSCLENPMNSMSPIRWFEKQLNLQRAVRNPDPRVKCMYIFLTPRNKDEEADWNRLRLWLVSRKHPKVYLCPCQSPTLAPLPPAHSPPEWTLPFLKRVFNVDEFMPKIFLRLKKETNI